MKDFDEIWSIAVARKGEEALEERFAHLPSSVEEAPEDRWLSTFARHIFSAGFVWRVVAAKWPDTEEAFHSFDVDTVANFDAADIDALAQDTRIIRNRQKIFAIVQNAQWIRLLRDEVGGIDAWARAWPSDNIVGLWTALKKGGSRLGGDSGPRCLRSMGIDTFIATGSVRAALAAHAGVNMTSSQRSAKEAQEAFNTWQAQSGRQLGELSIILACSVDS